MSTRGSRRAHVRTGLDHVGTILCNAGGGEAKSLGKILAGGGALFIEQFQDGTAVICFYGFEIDSGIRHADHLQYSSADY